MGWTYKSTSGLTIQVRLLPGLCCKPSAAGFAVVWTSAMLPVVFMLPLLNTWAIIRFGFVFLKLFPPYSRIAEKICQAPCLLPWTSKSWRSHCRFLCPLLAAASTSSGSVAAHSKIKIKWVFLKIKCPWEGQWGWSTEGRLPRNCFWDEHKTRGFWNVLTGLVLCLEVLSKESGSAMPPSQRLVQFPTEGRLFSTGTPPIWQRNRAYWHEEGRVGGQLSWGKSYWKGWKQLQSEAKNVVGILFFN